MKHSGKHILGGLNNTAVEETVMICTFFASTQDLSSLLERVPAQDALCHNLYDVL